MKIVFTGGGTLGHVMPNIYLMEELKNCEIFYIGGNGIEKEKLNELNVKYFEVPTTKFRRDKIFSNFKIPFTLINSINKCKKILKEIKPDIVFSKGGYVSLPVCIAARKLKIPIIAHESDYSFGLANKIILKLCTTMCVNFKNLEDKNNKCVYTGPIFSKNFEKTNVSLNGLNIYENKLTILIVGGSLGSQFINEQIYKILPSLIENFNIIHITGKGNLKIKSFGNYNAMEMCDNIVNLYNIADFVICRSGAGITAESYYKNLPMMLIPLENKSTRGDQLLNAKYYESLRVAEIVREYEFKEINFQEKILNFADNIEKFKMRYKKSTKINGKQKILDIFKDYKNKKN